MTDQDNLRDKIAVALAKAQNADYWTDEIERWESLDAWERDAYPDEYPGMAYDDRSDYRRIAQAIIDEFELTVETHVDLGALPDHLQGVWMDDPAFLEWEAKQPRKTRVVGKWEKQ